MPADDVSDLRDVVDAINRLCDTMKTSQYDDVVDDGLDEIQSDDRLGVEVATFHPIVTELSSARETRESWDVSSFASTELSYTSADVCSASEASYVATETSWHATEVAYVPTEASQVATYPASEVSDLAAEILECIDVASPEEVSIRTIEVQERWSDSLMSLPVTSDAEPAAQCEPASELYYTASSEVSLLSDTEVQEVQESPEGREERACAAGTRQECVMAGHVAAMRERFESMTRTNTPCPDLVRSSSPSLDVFRNVTPDPDRLE